jgi:transcriptional regulator with XRE-family HTH domain
VLLIVTKPRKKTVGRPRQSTPSDPDLAALGRAIKELIEADPELSQAVVAERSGVNEDQVGRYVRGQGNPSYSTLVKLADDGLRVPLGVLFRRAEALRTEARDNRDEPAHRSGRRDARCRLKNQG